MTVHLLKMCVGIDTVSQLRASVKRRAADRKARGEPVELTHMTRHIPRREDEIVEGGSLYWVIKGFVRARQPILRIDRLDPPVRLKRCALVLAPRIVETQLQPRRPHQGWRYLEPRDAPPDRRGGSRTDDEPPEEMATALRELGLL